MNNIQRVLSEGRLIRKTWSEVSDGRQLLCLYTAWRGDPDARPGACTVKEAPYWFAELMPWIDDAGSEKKWPEVVARVAALEPKFSKFGRRELLGCLIVILAEAQRHMDSSSCRSVAALCERELSGGVVSKAEWEVIIRATVVGVDSTLMEAVEETAKRAARTASATGPTGVEPAVWAAVWAARVAALEVGEEEASDRIIDGILTVLEKSS